MIIYYESKNNYYNFMKSYLSVLLYLLIGSYTMNKFQYENFYENNKIKYVRYYIIINEDIIIKKNNFGFNQKDLYYYA